MCFLVTILRGAYEFSIIYILDNKLIHKYKTNRKRRYSNVSRFRINKNGLYEKCNYLDMVLMNKRKRKNFYWIFSNLFGMEIIERTNKQYIAFKVNFYH